MTRDSLVCPSCHHSFSLHTLVYKTFDEGVVVECQGPAFNTNEDSLCRCQGGFNIIVRIKTTLISEEMKIK